MKLSETLILLLSECIAAGSGQSEETLDDIDWDAALQSVVKRLGEYPRNRLKFLQLEEFHNTFHQALASGGSPPADGTVCKEAFVSQVLQMLPDSKDHVQSPGIRILAGKLAKELRKRRVKLLEEEMQTVEAKISKLEEKANKFRGKGNSTSVSGIGTASANASPAFGAIPIGSSAPVLPITTAVVANSPAFGSALPGGVFTPGRVVLDDDQVNGILKQHMKRPREAFGADAEPSPVKKRAHIASS